MLKVELHSHTADDPLDAIPFTTRELIDRAVALHYDALAITLHDRQLDIAPFVRFAAERGLLLIPGVERTIEGCHVLLLNFSDASEDVRTFADLRHFKQRHSGLVVAPHPFFPARTALLHRLSRHADLFDAVEYNAMFTTSLNFNLPAERWAARHGKPMVGNGDVHRLVQLGTTYSMVDAEPNPDAICAAIAAGRVQVVKHPLSWASAISIIADVCVPRASTLQRSPQVARVERAR